MTSGPPGGPTNLRATAISAKRIDLSWTSHSKGNGYPDVFRKSGAGNYAQVNRLGPDSTSAFDVYLSPGTTYTYQVRATLPGFTVPSNEATATTTHTVPRAPIGLTARPLSLTRIWLEWQDQSADETAWDIERQSPGGPWQGERI